MSKPIPPRPGASAVRARLAEILRVDHAGELGAVHIYQGQRAVLGAAKGRERIAAQLEEMEGHEAVHACTEAVESVIEQHYAGQIAELSEQEPELAAQLAQFRDEELAHRDLAVEEGAHQAPGYAALSAVIRAGCRAAIKLSEKV